MEWIVIFIRNFLSWSKNWYSVIFSSFETIIFILAFGVGFNNLIGEINGVRYIEFILPSLVIIPSMNISFFETTYNSFSKMYYGKIFHSYLYTPANVKDIYIGEVLWAVARGLISSFITIMLLVILSMNTFGLWKNLVLIVMCVITGISFSAIGLLLTSVSPSINFFDYIFYVYLSPIMFLSGTFFPISAFPEFVKWIMFVVSPIYHVLNIFRGEANYLSFFYLVVLLSILIILGIRLLERRLVE